jgi:nucleotide-binding universal stress UspA family protein
MYRVILVPLGGSPLAECALPPAVALARAAGARLRLVRASLVRNPPEAGTAEAQICEHERAYLESLARRLAAQGVEAEPELRFGDASDAIVEVAGARRADLLVMATHGRGGLGRLLFGSVAAGVLGRAPGPLLLVRAATARPDGAPFGATPRLLVPLDGSAFAEEALPAASALAAILNGELVLVRVTAQDDPVRDAAPVDEAGAREHRDDVPDLLPAAARDYLERVAVRLRQGGRRVQVEVRRGEPAEAIAGVARERGAALIAMATHGYTGAQRVLLGGVADAVARQIALPLLLVRPRALVATPDPAAEGAARRAGPPVG